MTFELSPFFMAIVAFCFSMTIGVLWEFVEYGMDLYTASDMQVILRFNLIVFTPHWLQNTQL